jgi:predicted transglutaminase-like cysteine proteinase
MVTSQGNNKGRQIMKRSTLRAALLLTSLLAESAIAQSATSEADRAFQPGFGAARPPIGYVRFCAEYPKACQAQGGIKRVAMDPDRWNLLYQVNTYVNGKIKPESDQQIYGEPERWAYPTDVGDCEDYMLLKQKYLIGLGFPQSALLATVVLDEHLQGHAVLTIETEAGDYVLDNRNNEIIRWNDTPYTFLKRQSPQDPRLWIALQKDRKATPADMSASQRN